MAAIGIDLGTTMSKVAVWQNGRVEIIRNEQSKRLTPSCVAFADNRVIVGEGAKYQEQVNVKDTVINAKRLLGKTYSDLRNIRTPYTIVAEGNRPMLEFEYHGKLLLSVEEIYAMLLTKMKEISESFLGAQVTQAVIAVPAHFTDSKRQATLDAAKMAGLEVLRLINEPTAAALAFGVGKETKDTRNVLVYDLGGGSLEVALVKITDGMEYKVMATSSDPNFGGEDFTKCFLETQAQSFCAEFGNDILSDSRAMKRLKIVVEKAKQSLSISNRCKIEVDSLYDGIDYHTAVSREDFEDACQPLLSVRESGPILTPIKDVLEFLGLDRSSIDDVVLVGGSSRIPIVQKILRNYFKGKELNLSVNQDEAVAYGAAFLADQLAGPTQGSGKFKLIDTSSSSYSINGHFKLDRHHPLDEFMAIGPFYVNNEMVTVIEECHDENKTRENIIFDMPAFTTISGWNLDSNGLISLASPQNQIKKRPRLSTSEITQMMQRLNKIKDDDQEEEELSAARSEVESYAYRALKRLMPTEDTSEKAELVLHIRQIQDQLYSSHLQKEDYKLQLDDLKLRMQGK